MKFLLLHNEKGMKTTEMSTSRRARLCEKAAFGLPSVLFQEFPQPLHHELCNERQFSHYDEYQMIERCIVPWNIQAVVL